MNKIFNENKIGVKSRCVTLGNSFLIFETEEALAYLRDKVNLSSVTKRDRVNLVAWSDP